MATCARRQIGTVVYQEEEEDEEEKEARGNKLKWVTPLTLEYMRTKWGPKCLIFQRGRIGRRSLNPQHPVLVRSTLGKIWISRVPSLW